MTTDWIFGWWNLVFIAPFALALIYLGVYAASGLTFGDTADADADHDFDADADHDIDADHDVDADADHDVDADADADADHDADTEHDSDSESDHAPGQTSSILAALTWLGVGRVPLSLIGMVLLMTWGALGFITNVLALPHVAQPWQAAIFSLPIALLGSIAITSGISGLIIRYFPLHETSARRRHELLGCVGEAIYTIDQTSGVLMVRDEDGNLFQVACRVTADQTPIGKGSRVRLVSYRAADNVFFGKPTNPAPAAAGAN